MNFGDMDNLAWRIGGKLATFTFVNLIANVSALLCRSYPPIHVVSPWQCSDALSFAADAVWEKQTVVGESAHGSASTVREPEFSDVSEIHLNIRWPVKR